MPFNPYQALGSVIFWVGLFLLLTASFLGSTMKLAISYVRTRTGALVAGVYITAHLLLYGFVLEGILVVLYKIPPFVYSSFAFLSTDTLYPPSFANAVVGLAFSPSISLQFPPVFELSLSIFSIFIAVVIDALILANVAMVRRIADLGSWTTKSRAYLLMPFTGVVLGASCCMSLPLLLSMVSPSLSAANNLIWGFYVAYFVLPPLAIVLLKLNLDLTSKIGAKVQSSAANRPPQMSSRMGSRTPGSLDRPVGASSPSGKFLASSPGMTGPVERDWYLPKINPAPINGLELLALGHSIFFLSSVEKWSR